MKFRIPELALGSLACIAVIALGMTIGSSLLPPQNHELRSGTAEPQQRADERIAEYTLWLAIFTGALVLVSGIQGYFLLRADRTARISAEAANLSARAAIAIELPIIRVKPENLTNGSSRDKANVMQDWCFVHSVTFSNLGRTNAYPLELSYGYSVAVLPKVPRYKWVEPFLPNLIFPADPQTAPRKNITETESLDFGVWGLVCSGQVPVWFYCELTYLDFMQTRREASFCWKWQNVGNGMGWRPDDAPAYNRKT